MSIKTPPEAINREALMFGVMAGVIAVTAMTLIAGMNFLIAALIGVLLAVAVWFVVVQLGKETSPPRGEGNLDTPAQVDTPAEAKPQAAPSAAASSKPAEPKAAAPAASEPETSVGERPEPLASARASGADDLKKIKGVGPKLEKLLHSMGVYHFDQIADWTPAHVAWMDENLQGFKGRVSRDDWVGQARDLA